MDKIFLIILTVLLLTGCAFNRGSGIDKIPRSECANCKKKPFYINGQWIKNEICK